MAAAGQQQKRTASDKPERERRRGLGQRQAIGSAEEDREQIQTTTADGNVDTSGCCDHNQVSSCNGPAANGEAEAEWETTLPSSYAAARTKRRRRTKRAASSTTAPADGSDEQDEREQEKKPQVAVYLHEDYNQRQQQRTEKDLRSKQKTANNSQRPLILITEPNESCGSPRSLAQPSGDSVHSLDKGAGEMQPDGARERAPNEQTSSTSAAADRSTRDQAKKEPEDQFEVIDGISYRIVAAVTKRPAAAAATSSKADAARATGGRAAGQQSASPTAPRSKFQSVRRKSSAFVANLLQSSAGFLVPQSRSSHAIETLNQQQQQPRRLSIYEMTKSPPPETSIEMYLNQRRRSSTVSAKFVQQQLEQQSTFESNYCARQQYFKDLNEKLIKQDNKNLLNVVANRGQIHRHSVDIAQLPLFLAQSSSGNFRPTAAASGATQAGSELDTLDQEILEEEEEEDEEEDDGAEPQQERRRKRQLQALSGPINQAQGSNIIDQDQQRTKLQTTTKPSAKQLQQQQQQQQLQLASISEASGSLQTDRADWQQRNSLGQLGQQSSDKRHRRRLLSQSSQSSNLIVRRFQKFDAAELSCAPSPDVKIGQRVAYKEYYGNEFGTIRWIGRVPQISPDWTVGVEFDNAIGEGDGSLNGRRYFIAKDCFAKFLPLVAVALVDQHVGRPEPGTMISVMSAAVRPGQMISIQRVSTVHVQHCFLNAPHQRPGAEFLAVNTRLHCQCPSCGPCAHVVKPPRTQRLITPKNATHMCQFSTYTCCGMESSDEALCTYTGNKISSLPPPVMTSSANGGHWPPVGNSWMEGSGYLSQLQAEQRKLMPEEYRLGAAPEDTLTNALLRRTSSDRRRWRDGRDGVGVADSTNPPECDVDCRSPAADQVRAGSRASSGRRRHHHKHKHRHAFPAARTSPATEENQRLDVGLRSPIYANLGQAREEAVEMQNGQSQQQQKSSKPLGLDAERQAGNLGPDSEFNDVMPSACCQQPDSCAAVAVGEDQSDYATAARDVNGAERRHQVAAAKFEAGPVDDVELGSDSDTELAAATRPAVQYRDSIENRYLFPTDDVIDSTLEADLETLSQARYGRFGQAHSSVSNCSSEDSPRRRKRPTAAARLTRAARRRWRGDDTSNQNGKRSGARKQREPSWGRRKRREKRRKRRWVSADSESASDGGALDKRNNRRHHSSGDRRRGTSSQISDDEDQYDQLDYHQVERHHRRRSGRTTPSRNLILKGLRSLVVSCLSANEQPSGATTPTSKSNSARHRRNVDSASPAALQVECANLDDVGCCCRPGSAVAAPFAHYFNDQNGLGDELHQAEVLAGQLEQLNLSKAAANTAAFMSWAQRATTTAQDDQLEANYYMNLDLESSSWWLHHNRHRHHHQDHLARSAYECDNFKEDTKPDDGRDPASSLHWGRQQAEIGQQPSEPPARRQISSSSDCGFSSASQNSMNLTNSNSSSNEAQTNGRQSNAEEQRELVQIYKRLAAQLAKSAGQDSTSSDNLLRLKRALIEVHSESCNSCHFHDMCQQPASKQSGSESQRGASRPQVQPNSSYERSAPAGDEQTKASSAEMVGDGEANPSSEPSSRALSRDCDQFDESQRAPAARPFELKLTLSFNPDLTTVSNFNNDRKQA